MKSKWKKFIEKLKIPSKFYHRDEFFKMLKTHPHKIANITFPAIFFHKKGKLSILIKSNEINEIKTLESLMNLIGKKILEI